MDLAPDFDEFIGCLIAHGVDFVIVGAYAPSSRFPSLPPAQCGADQPGPEKDKRSRFGNGSGSRGVERDVVDDERTGDKAGLEFHGHDPTGDY